MADAKGVEAVDRALSVLACFTQEEPAHTLTELARRTGFYKSTILRLAVSLERGGYLSRDGAGVFRLGVGAWRLGAVYRSGLDLGHLLRPELDGLCAATRETASFYVRDGDRRVCLYRVEPVRGIRHAIKEGARIPLSLGASGKVLMAFAGGAGQGDAIIRAQGYATSMGERDPEVAAVAVPLFAGRARLVGALSISGLITRFGPAEQQAMITALRASQQRLAGLLPE